MQVRIFKENEIVNDVIYIWQAASLPIISFNRIQTKLKGLVAKFEGTKSSIKGAKGVSESWLDTTFGICKCNWGRVHAFNLFLWTLLSKFWNLFQRFQNQHCSSFQITERSLIICKIAFIITKRSNFRAWLRKPFCVKVQGPRKSENIQWRSHVMLFIGTPNSTRDNIFERSENLEKNDCNFSKRRCSFNYIWQATSLFETSEAELRLFETSEAEQRLFEKLESFFSRFLDLLKMLSPLVKFGVPMNNSR